MFFRLLLVSYNRLPDDTQQPAILGERIQELAALFVRYNAHTKLGIHLIHGHFAAPEKAIMLGSNFSNPLGRWSKITRIDSFDPTTIHGHIFVLTTDGFRAYEYQEGPIPDLSGVDDAFYSAFVEYLVTHNLSDLVGLQVLFEDRPGSMWELLLDDGTVMLDASAVQDCVPLRQTGWKFELHNGKPSVCQSNETHAAKTSGNHQVFNAGKPHPNLRSVLDLKEALASVGIL